MEGNSVERHPVVDENAESRNTPEGRSGGVTERTDSSGISSFGRSFSSGGVFPFGGVPSAPGGNGVRLAGAGEDILRSRLALGAVPELEGEDTFSGVPPLLDVDEDIMVCEGTRGRGPAGLSRPPAVSEVLRARGPTGPVCIGYKVGTDGFGGGTVPIF